MFKKKLSISERGEKAPASPIRKLVPFSDQAKQKGIKVYHLNIGQPDFHIPPEIQKELLGQSANLKILSYAHSQGEKTLIEAFVKYYADCEIDIKSEDVLIASGGSEAIILAMAVVLDPKDNMIVFEPFYANYLGFGSMLETEIIPVKLDPNKGYHLPSESEIAAKINKRTKAIFFTNPNNPTGTVFTKKEMEIILKIAREHNLFIISDETYRGICFDGVKSYSMLEIAQEIDRERIIVVDSLSKRMNITGARIGVVISKNKEVMSGVLKYAQARLSVATLEQLMVVPMLKNCIPYVEDLAKHYKNRRDVFLKELEKGLEIKIHYPEGAFYTMLKLPVKSSEDFCKWLLTDFSYKNSTVMLAPGSGFYATKGEGSNEARVAFVLNEEELKKAAEVLIHGIKEYQKLG
ncbi:hypothetical protein A2X44_04805 [candidate division CPR3 bacterium GWF2_35_18]|uniref:Aminotransferase n=1 Tax=candidate division CPR3 bacterium GW2011_GWF2_35_18 TaxID=1618350 RepID=A0A0G0BJU7_UNCC3|nr:MAG: Aminotransferase, class I and II [candidate division CPR3 bacterium GW2011_GWF2_35_18]OGB63653.1 MAG: hypothetical protein A2X44_04805 [candidate division CPR3 bacterium GWF2_35_18]OGB65026.1 MAG: hypothetical protein A2250_01235 [candidate division CPR3 bacterium RIFOXYA2_FULL_35_13]OGB79544.1 MAG: hypothetical protein A2296_04465 [candidate division CPR3 bacterium RIFOXYB2_FULL_35_8]